jgi:hypothetical protein
MVQRRNVLPKGMKIAVTRVMMKTGTLSSRRQSCGPLRTSCTRQCQSRNSASSSPHVRDR